MEKLKAILLGLILATASTAAIPHDDTEADDIRNAICRATLWEGCKATPVPVAVKSTNIVLLAQKLWYGNRPVTLFGFFYPGERFIYIRTDVSQIRMYETLVHESVHYYYDNTRPGGERDRCESEYLARFYTTKVLSTSFDPTWWDRYDCLNYRNAPKP